MERGVSIAIEKFSQPWISKCNPDSHTRDVLNHIKDCRTEVMGGTVMVCPECGAERIVWNSCGDRHCPNCQTAPREAWLLSRKEELLPVTYFHVVFTVPACLNTVFLKNKAISYSILFSAAWNTIKTFAKTAGIKIGMTSLLHTWGSNLVFHPHLHCIVTGGGARLDDGRWKTLPQLVDKKNEHPFLFPVKALSDMFRAKFISQLASKVRIDPDVRNSCFIKPWVVFTKSPVSGVEKTLEYLTRYAYRVAISNYRIQSIDNKHVTFDYKDYRDDTTKIMTLSGEEFVGRYAQHILPERFVRIRHYGILAPKNRNLLRKLQTELGVTPVPPRKKRRTWKEVCQITGFEIGRCQDCKVGIMQLIDRIPSSRPKGRPRARSPEFYLANEVI